MHLSISNDTATMLKCLLRTSALWETSLFELWRRNLECLDQHSFEGRDFEHLLSGSNSSPPPKGISMLCCLICCDDAGPDSSFTLCKSFSSSFILYSLFLIFFIESSSSSSSLFSNCFSFSCVFRIHCSLYGMLICSWFLNK